MKPTLYIFLLFAVWFSQSQGNDGNFLGFPQPEDIAIPVSIEAVPQNQNVEGNGDQQSEETPVLINQQEEQEVQQKEEEVPAQPEAEGNANTVEEETREGDAEPIEAKETQEEQNQTEETKETQEQASEQPQEQEQDLQQEQTQEQEQNTQQEQVAQQEQTQEETAKEGEGDGNQEETESLEDEVCENESVEDYFQILTPEQQAYKDRLYEMPEIPEGYSQVKMGMIRTDKTIMKAYSFSIPSFLLKGISLHHRFTKSHSEEEREHLFKKGFLMPGPYKLDLVYIWRKRIEQGYIYKFGIVVNRCLEKECLKRPFSCKNVAFFSSFEPLPTGKRQFLDWGVEMAPEGFMNCPNYAL